MIKGIRKDKKLFFFAMFFYGVIMFMLGFHTIDNAFNLHTVSEATGTVWFDISIMGGALEPSELYRLGLFQIFTGFVTSVIFAYIIAQQKENQLDARSASVPEQDSDFS